MMDSHGVELPLPVVWNPPGPFNIEIDEIGMGWDTIALLPDLLSAARKASWLVRHDWRTARNERRVMVHGPHGAA